MSKSSLLPHSCPPTDSDLKAVTHVPALVGCSSADNSMIFIENGGPRRT